MPFSYIGPSTSFAFTAGVFNDATNLAKEKALMSDSKIEAAIAELIDPPLAEQAKFAMADIPNLPEPPEFDGLTTNDLTDLASSQTAEVKALIAEMLGTYFSDYFPLGEDYEAAVGWVKQAIEVGGTGVDPGVEADIWARERMRMAVEEARDSGAVYARWAARGFSLPPGALVGELSKISHDYRFKKADTSYNIAEYMHKAELENVRFAITASLNNRRDAINAASEYIKTMVLGPQLGVQMASSLADARAKFNSAAAQAYSALMSGFDVPVRAGIAELQANTEINKLNNQHVVSNIEARVRMADSAAQMYATQAAAALNGISARVAGSANENITV